MIVQVTLKCWNRKSKKKVFSCKTYSNYLLFTTVNNYF